MQRPYLFPLLLQRENRTQGVKSKITGNIYGKETGHGDQNLQRTFCTAYQKWQHLASMKNFKTCVVSVLSLNKIDMSNVNNA